MNPVAVRISFSEDVVVILDTVVVLEVVVVVVTSTECNARLVRL